MFVKICGLSEPVTLRAAVGAGAQALGFVFAPGSPRAITPHTAHELIRLVPQSVETVGVFRHQPIDQVLAVAQAAGVQTIQFHGDETLADLDRARAEGFGTVRALSVDEYLIQLKQDPKGLNRHRLLLDAPLPGAGIPFDPAALLSHPPQGDWLLAGGLNPSNVAELIQLVRPAGVDVSSGVETTRGVKDVGLIKGFIAAARGA